MGCGVRRLRQEGRGGIGQQDSQARVFYWAGACYKVKCLDHGICSRRAVTDECPGGVCSGGRTHFDLSGAAFSRMAVAGGRLRDRGELSVVYRSHPELYSTLACDSRAVANSVQWLDMKHVWGATWCLVQGPLSVRLTTLSGKKTLTARDVIPRNWTPKAIYTARPNFDVSL
ncbi:hypothetical protein EJB05_18789, partial [Eragrostis curvula]